MNTILAVMGIEVIGAIFFGFGFLCPENDPVSYVFFVAGISVMAIPLGAILWEVQETKKLLGKIRADQLVSLSLKEKS